MNRIHLENSFKSIVSFISSVVKQMASTFSLTTEQFSTIDIVSAFECAGLANGFKLNILGTPDDPLFQANQVGELLDISTIRSSIRDFDEDETCVRSMPTSGGPRSIVFLTELGLYRLLGMSRKPIARSFQKWVAKVVKEIRINHMYTLKTQMTQTLAGITDAHTQEIAAQEEVHRIAAKKTLHHALMHSNSETPLLYFAEVGELPNGRKLYKFGETDNIIKREPRLRMDYGTVYFVKLYVCTQPHKYEQWLKNQPLFIKYKYTEHINGCRHNEVLALTPGEYITITRFIDKHMNIFEGWTPAQQLEKIRLQSQVQIAHFQERIVNSQSLVSIFDKLPAIIALITNPIYREIAEKSVVDTISKLGNMVNKNHVVDSSFSSENVNIPESTSVLEEDLVLSNEPDIEEPLSEPAIIENTVTTPFPQETPAPILYPPQPPKKKGRPPKPKPPPPTTTANTPLQEFLGECFTTDDPESRTHVAHVRARHRLWRKSHVNRDETNKMVEFFKGRFQSVQEMDATQDMKCSFYKGLAMCPWAPDTTTLPTDIREFINDSCEVHVMGRATSADLWDTFVTWKKERDPLYEGTTDGMIAFIKELKKSPFVYHTGIPVTKEAIGLCGFYGLYLLTATEECRQVGYNRSPNTHGTIVKLDAAGTIVDMYDSQDYFSHNIAKKASQYICRLLTKNFKNGMKGLILPDGYCYMRKNDHSALLASQAATAATVSAAA